MQSYDVHDQLLEAYESARKRHRGVLERFFPVSAYSHGQRFERPGAIPSRADLLELTRLADEEHAAHQAWVDSFGGV